MHILHGVRFDHGFVERDAEARGGGQAEVAIDHLGQTGRGLQDILLVKVVEVFLNLKVGGAGCQMECRRGGNCSADIVRCHKQSAKCRAG